MPELTILTEQELRQCVGLDDALVDTIATGFKALASGGAASAPTMRLSLGGDNSQIHAKAAYLRDTSSFALKVGPSSSAPGGALMLFDAASKQIETLLLDNGYLAKLQAAAAGALAARHLSRSNARVAGILGAGPHAYRHAEALFLARDIDRVLLWDTDASAAEALGQRIKQAHGAAVEILDGAEPVVRQADIVVTATPARSPIVQVGWLHPGLHITAVGANTGDKNELAPEVLAEADLYVADSREQCRWSGELNHAIGAGLINEGDRIIELGEIICGLQGGRVDDEEITVVDLTGTGVQDAAVAAHALERALAQGLGKSVQGN